MYRLLKDRFDHKAETTVYGFIGWDYGLAADDATATGVAHVSVTLDPDGKAPFFTVPLADIERIPDPRMVREAMTQNPADYGGPYTED